MKETDDYWNALEKLISENGITIDRKKGTKHPRYPDLIYSVNYGYINNSKSMDNNEIDIFEGEDKKRKVNGIFCTIDLLKQDSETKVVYACNSLEIENIQMQFDNSKYMKSIYVSRK